jgi:hypothetical protein
VNDALGNPCFASVNLANSVVIGTVPPFLTHAFPLLWVDPCLAPAAALCRASDALLCAMRCAQI